MASDVETVDKSNKRFFDIGKRRNEINVAEERSDSKSNHIKLKKRSFTVSIKNSLCGIFKSHKMASTNDDKNNTPTERSCVQISSRCLPPIPFGSSDVDLECQEVPVNELVKQCAILPNENTGLLADDINRDIGNSCMSFINRSPEAIDADDFDSCKYREEPKTGLCTYVDFATNFSKVQDCGWYWGPISSEYAEKQLMNEPNGSFLVRDSSDDHYIFSLTVKLSGCIRHVRIEHSQGCFSFGSYVVFRNQTIVDFIENAMKHSRSGRYLFFLHRRPTHGPMRVQLLYPVSRFKKMQSLQHMCRFVILKSVRRDLISLLPLPPSLLDYLNNPQYFLE